MIELFIDNQNLRIKSNVDVSVASVERFNSDPLIDMDIITLMRILYPKRILSSGSGSLVADRSVAKENGLYFSKDLTIMDMVDIIRADPLALEYGNQELAQVEKQFASIIKKRAPLQIDNRSYAAYINKLSNKRDEIIKKLQPYFTADVSQKTDDLRFELADKYGVDPKRISKESVATSELSSEKKSELFELMDIFNIQQELTNLSKLEGHNEYNYSFIPFGSVSGRSSTFADNIHGMTKAQFGIFTKKMNGMRLVSIDFSQVELRLAASLWGDHNMQNVFNKGEDIHMNTAKMVGSRDRQLAKAINFGLLYGMGIETFMVYCAKDFGIILTYDEAKHYVETFKKSYPMLFDKNMTEFSGLSYKTKTLNREMHAQDIYSGAYDMKKFTIARNIQIQGEGADILKLSVIELNKMLSGIGEIAFEMYDEIGFWIKDDSDINIRLNAICDDLTGYIKAASGFSIPVQISDRF